MYLEHIFPSYTRSHTEQALSGSGIAFPSVDEKLLDRTITRLIATGYLRRSPRGREWTAGLGRAMPVSRYPDWASFKM